MKIRLERRSLVAGALLVGVYATTTGCAGTEKADADIARAKVRVEQAQQGGAGQFAAAELQASVDNLRKAEAAAADGNEDEARQLAKRAELDASVAAAKTSRAKADAAAREVQSGTDTLRDEADRALTTPPAPVAEPSTENM